MRGATSAYQQQQDYRCYGRHSLFDWHTRFMFSHPPTQGRVAATSREEVGQTQRSCFSPSRATLVNPITLVSYDTYISMLTLGIPAGAA
jgi:hypothetical protein